MADPVLLICGPYSEEEEARLRNALPHALISGSGEIGGLPEATRATIRALAYKGHHGVGAAEMDALPALGIIANYGVGYDSIDVAAARERGITVTNTPDVLNDDVADLAVALTIAVARNMIEGDARVREGRWAQEGELPLNRKVAGSTVGIMGLGRIGREIADRFAAFKAQIHYHSRSEKETPGWTYHDDPRALAEAVEIMVVALVGGESTRNYVTREVIDALGPRGILVNISRGTTVDEPALLDALEAGRIAGAGLDVYLNEPDPDPRFLKLPNVVLQPHQGSGTVETRRAMAELQLRNVTEFLDGKVPPTPVT
jgi:lactate dehydrogenase-like 2-hydroxyacid dehydrogenase